MIKDDISELIAGAVQRAQAAGDIPAVPVPSAPIERPQRPEHGDYATSLPMRLARGARMAPMEIAEAIRKHLDSAVRESVAIEEASVAPPGFINLRLSARLARSPGERNS